MGRKEGLKVDKPLRQNKDYYYNKYLQTNTKSQQSNLKDLPKVTKITNKLESDQNKSQIIGSQDQEEAKRD